MTRANARRALLIALLLWPLAHMALARQVGFSPWRFGGWGMYAVPEGFERILLVFERDTAGRLARVPVRLLGVDIADDLERNAGLRVYARTSGAPPDAIDLDEIERVAAIGQDMRRARQLADDAALARAVGVVVAAAGAGAPPVKVLVAEQRVDVRAGRGAVDYRRLRFDAARGALEEVPPRGAGR